jgi:hypothetical protein
MILVLVGTSPLAAGQGKVNGDGMEMGKGDGKGGVLGVLIWD